MTMSHPSLHPQHRTLLTLMVLCAALATITSEAGLLHWHWLFKPLTMVIAIVLVATSAYPISARAQFNPQAPTAPCGT